MYISSFLSCRIFQPIHFIPVVLLPVKPLVLIEPSLNPRGAGERVEYDEKFDELDVIDDVE